MWNCKSIYANRKWEELHVDAGRRGITSCLCTPPHPLILLTTVHAAVPGGQMDFTHYHANVSESGRSLSKPARSTCLDLMSDQPWGRREFHSYSLARKHTNELPLVLTVHLPTRWHQIKPERQFTQRNKRSGDSEQVKSWVVFFFNVPCHRVSVKTEEISNIKCWTGFFLHWNKQLCCQYLCGIGVSATLWRVSIALTFH